MSDSSILMASEWWFPDFAYGACEHVSSGRSSGIDPETDAPVINQNICQVECV